MRRAIVWWGVSALLAWSAGCAVDSVSTPAPTGPSEMSLSLGVSLKKTVLAQDGNSTVELEISARDSKNLPLLGLEMRVDILVRNAAGAWVAADFGTLTNRWPVTDSKGEATLIYRSPPPPAPGTADDRDVRFDVTPIGARYAGEPARSVVLRLVRPGVILPPTRMVPRFTFSPSAPREFEPIIFDASASSDPDRDISSYEWSMGNGDVRAGRILTYEYPLNGSYGVVLTVRNSSGVGVSSETQIVAVASSPIPTALFTVSPVAPEIGERVVFNAAASVASPGRRIVAYNWDLGDGTFPDDTGPAPTHVYSRSGTFSVILTVTDDAGRKGVRSQTVVVAERTRPTAVFVYSPTDPAPGETVHFSAEGSSPAPGRTIVRYSWNFGDGSAPVEGVKVQRAFPSERTYTVTLTVTDDVGRQAVLSRTVTVKVPTA